MAFTSSSCGQAWGLRSQARGGRGVWHTGLALCEPAARQECKTAPWAVAESRDVGWGSQMKLATTALLTAMAATGAAAQTNVGLQAPEASLPFVMTSVATFNTPWRLAFLPDGRMLVTEKPGPVWLVTQA